MQFTNLLIALGVLLILTIGVLFIDNLFLEKLPYVDREKLDTPFSKNLIVIFSRIGCVFCDRLVYYLEENKDKIKLNIVTVTFGTFDGITYSDSYKTISDKDKQKINTLKEENEKNPMFGFPTLYKDTTILKGFDEPKLPTFFEIN